MFRNVLDNPVLLIVLVLIIVLVFGANKLPGAARSLGRSMRIFKSEVRQMNDESPRRKKDTDDEALPGRKDADEEALEGRVVNEGRQEGDHSHRAN